MLFEILFIEVRAEPRSLLNIDNPDLRILLNAPPDAIFEIYVAMPRNEFRPAFLILLNEFLANDTNLLNVDRAPEEILLKVDWADDENLLNIDRDETDTLLKALWENVEILPNTFREPAEMLLNETETLLKAFWENVDILPKAFRELDAILLKAF